MKKMDDRIASMEQQLKALKERRVRAEAKRKREDAQRAKKDGTRRKLLAGAVVLEKVDRGEIKETDFKGWLDSALTQPEDRALFNL